MTDHLVGSGAGGGLLGCTQQERSSRDSIVCAAASLEPTSMLHHVRDGYVRLGGGGRSEAAPAPPGSWLGICWILLLDGCRNGISLSESNNVVLIQ